MSQLLTLASGSPRRKELLAALGFALEIRPADLDESVRPGEAPRDYVSRLAREKAAAVKGEVVVAADTTVVQGDQILGKPADVEDAKRMLRGLSNTMHRVLTGVCARRGKVELSTVVATEVHFAALSEEQIAWYVGTREPMDKAGAYALQGAGGVFVRAVSGSVSNVVGLPIHDTMELLRKLGVALPWEIR